MTQKTEEEKMYGHLPYWELFSQHQGDYLNETDWLKIVKTIEENTTKRLLKTISRTLK